MKNCTITNSYGTFPDRSTCRAGEVVYPSSEEEIVAAVAKATMNKRKMKVATRYSHSIPKLVCPQGDDGLLISTRNLDRKVDVDKAAMTMTVESGVTLRVLIAEAAKSGLALPYSPYWWGLTIGGLIGTGAHGSSVWNKGSSVHEYVVGIRIVTPASPSDGYAKVRSLTANDPDINAAKVSLGVIGVISQVTLKLEPLFKRSITLATSNDSDLSEKALTFGHQHEFADLIWYPSQRMVLYRIDDRVSSNASGNGKSDFVGFRSTTALTLALVRSTEETQEATRDANGKCRDGKITISMLMASAFGLTNNGVIFTGYPVVGSQHRLQASGSCLDSIQDARLTACPWDHRVKGSFFHQTTFTIGLSNVKNFIQDVQKLRDLAPKAFCGVDLYDGILMRYVKSSPAYLGKEEDGLDIDITYYRSNDPMTPRLFEDILEEVEQMALFKYGGLPHWGKNRNLAFDGAIKKYPKARAFLKVKQRYDPMALFSSDWTDQVLGINGRPIIVKEGCALEGLCICSEDLHCAPKKGYYCRQGKVYKDARVCTRLELPPDGRVVQAR
ncbi:probable L-gulonolactone oxidase 6 [Aristolochia californica]|uniref:probable L-gulonolactone oxidase 6 n=1 Tax=Aristolochia californica TaxID=171875 RepID=UPI0035D85F34